MRSNLPVQHRPNRASAAFIALLTLVSTGACSAESEPATANEPSPSGPAFVISTRIWDDTSIHSYFHVVPSLDSSTELDLSKALEVAGSARLFAFEDIGWFAVGGGEDPTITRYTLNARNELLADDDTTIGLQDYGVMGLWNTMYLVSPTKAYYPDRAGQQLVVWNPTTMALEGTIPLPETRRGEHLALYGYSSVLRGKKLMFSVGWFDWDTNDTVLDETGLVTIDTETDTVERFDVDDRCGGITELVETDAGDVYFVSSALGASAYRLERMETEPCALRMPKDVNGFDPEYLVRLRDVTGGALAGDPVPGGGSGMFLRALDEDLADVAEGALTYEITSQSAWRWLRWDPTTNDVSEVSELRAAPANVSWFPVDGRVYTIEEKNDSTESTLIELTADGGPEVVFTAPGYLHAMARVR